MDLTEVALLFAAGTASGALNSVAGGGQFIIFPALMATGVPSIAANASSSIVALPGTLASAAAYRTELRALRPLLPPLIAVSLAGSAIGAILLVETPTDAFEALIPWLMLLATMLLVAGPTVAKRLRGTRPRRPGVPLGVIIVQALVGIYGGYFGAGMGFVMLAAFGMLGLGNIHAMNALKTLLATVISTVAVTIFIVTGLVAWTEVSVMIVGALVGGYGGASVARRLDPLYVRRATILLAATMTVIYFLRR